MSVLTGIRLHIVLSYDFLKTTCLCCRWSPCPFASHLIVSNDAVKVKYAVLGLPSAVLLSLMHSYFVPVQSHYSLIITFLHFCVNFLISVRSLLGQYFGSRLSKSEFTLVQKRHISITVQRSVGAVPRAALCHPNLHWRVFFHQD